MKRVVGVMTLSLRGEASHGMKGRVVQEMILRSVPPLVLRRVAKAMQRPLAMRRGRWLWREAPALVLREAAKAKAMRRVTRSLAMRREGLMVVGVLLLLLLWGCGEGSFKVRGIVSGADGQAMYLEKVGLSVVEALDSVKLTESGDFTFTHPRPQYPEFYRLRLNNQLIHFAIDSTETLVFTADAGTFATTYTVEGSEHAKAMKAITLAQLDANQSIGKLRRERESRLISDSLYGAQVLETAEAYKKVARQYIYTAPMSTPAYFALFQQVDGLLLFDLYDREDSKAYGAVATSFDHYYPQSPRAKHLHNLALQSIQIIRRQRALAESKPVSAAAIDFVDITLPDLREQPLSLTSIAQGKTVLLNFTAYQTEWSPALNMELARLYERYHRGRLEIYQVSLDGDEHYWKNVASRLPWLCVRDPEAEYSSTAALYNVRQLPAFFIIDRHSVLSRVENWVGLEAAIKRALR